MLFGFGFLLSHYIQFIGKLDLELWCSVSRALELEMCATMPDSQSYFCWQYSQGLVPSPLVLKLSGGFLCPAACEK